jgi:PAS domain S-box-containing protein
MASDKSTDRQAEFTNLTLSAQDFLDAVPAGVVAADAQGKIVGLNAELLRQFGYQPHELLGHAVEILVPVTLRNTHAAMRAGLLCPGRDTRDGRWSPAERTTQGRLDLPD